MKYYQRQVTEFDCVPTTFINALIHLYDKSQIHPEFLTTIYRFCLDLRSILVSQSRNESNLKMGGTSYWASEILTEMLNKTRIHNFAPSFKGYEDDKVTSKRIADNIRDNSVVITRVRHGSMWHFMLAISKDRDRIHFVDPYNPSNARIEGVEVLNNEASKTFTGPNLTITRAHLDRSSRERYCLGINEGENADRYCIVVKKR